MRSLHILICSLIQSDKLSILEFWKDIISIIQGLFTILAICAGFWLFFFKRTIYPKLKISHRIYNKKVSDDKILIRVEINITNTGEILTSITDAEVWIQQVLPCTEKISKSLTKNELCYEQNQTEYSWDLLCESKLPDAQKRELEPGEEDELYFDFILDSTLETIIINSHVKNIDKRNKQIGWNKSSFYDLTNFNNKGV